MLLVWLASCTSITDDFVAQKDPLKERFLALAFHERDNGSLINSKRRKPALLYKQQHIIAITGNAAQDYRQEIMQVLNFYGKHYNIKVSFGTPVKADIYLNLYALPQPKEGELARAIITAHQNGYNELLHPLTGWSRLYDENQKIKGLSDRLVRYEQDYWKTGAVSACNANWIWRDKRLMERFYGLSDHSLPKDWHQRPDFVVSNVFTGFKGDNLEEFYTGQHTSIEEQKALLMACLYEEIGHALTYWGDVPNDNYAPFSSGAQDYAHRKFHPSAQALAKEKQAYVIRYKNQLSSIDEILGFYKNYGLEEGMSYDEVRAALYSKD